MRQEQALHIMTSGRSVFLTGAAGSGKTFVLNQLIKQLKKEGKEVAITASTGIAATHIGGMTIHSWSGLGIRDFLTSSDKSWMADNSRLVKRYNMTDVLIIDEVSMLHGNRLNMINEVAKLLRRSDEPFGGMQLILTGDLFQLPPITRGGGQVDFVHQSEAWRELDPAICYLTSQYRQSEGELLRLLEALRSDSFDEFHGEVLQERVGMVPGKDRVLTRLFTHNIDVDSINNQQLAKLEADTETYQMESSGRKQFIEALQKSVLAPEILELKIGAEVMFVANNFAAGFANGTRGKVVDFENGYPVVQLQSGRKLIKVEEHTWRYEEDGKERASVSQLPLRLAWAITIHKSQGMSLDSALIDLSRAFTHGMGYVALSRVRSLDGLFLTGINSMALKLHPEIFEFDKRIRTLSLELAEATGNVPSKTELKEADDKQVKIQSELLAKLKSWRTERARLDGVPPYIVFNDKTLEELALKMPKSEAKLLGVNGFGPKKLKDYGPDVLNIIKNN